MADRHGHGAVADSPDPRHGGGTAAGGEAPTAEQLRHAIDSGETRDRIESPDPAAVPLGADDEAGGYSPSPAEGAAAYHQEVERRQRSTVKEHTRDLAAMLFACLVLALLFIALRSLSVEATAFVYVWLSIASAAFIVVDIFLLGHRQGMKVMEVVWPLTLLYWGPLGLPFYLAIGRTPVDGPHDHHEESMGRASFKGAAHCGAGCAIGDFAAEWIALATGFALFGSPLAGRFALSFALAYLVGIAFQYFAIAPMRGLSLRDGVFAAIRADTFSLIAYEVGMFAVMALRAWLWPALQPWDWTYWLIMQAAMVAGFATTYPVNWLLIRNGVKERM